MTIQLSQKERTLLEDQKEHEQICIQKYSGYASQAQDPQLKQIFTTHAGHEQQHLDTLNQILQGQVPNMAQQGQQGQQGQQNQSNSTQQFGMQSGQQGQFVMQAQQNDAALCQDMLMTEKYVSGAYDTAIFEFADTNIRKALNHIQKEEQQHGEDLFNYLNSVGMYNVQ